MLLWVGRGRQFSIPPMIRKIFSLVFDDVETIYLLKVISVPNIAGEMGSTIEASVQLSRLSFVVFILMLCLENGEKKGFF